MIIIIRASGRRFSPRLARARFTWSPAQISVRRHSRTNSASGLRFRLDSGFFRGICLLHDPKFRQNLNSGYIEFA